MWRQVTGLGFHYCRADRQAHFLGGKFFQNEIKIPLIELNNMDVMNFKRCATHLPVKNLKQTLDYYMDKLGFSDKWTFSDKDGGIRRDDMRLLFCEDPEFVMQINNQKHRLPLLWFVSDIDKIFVEFIDRKIKIADDLRAHPYGLREFAFIDINGYYIRVAEADDAENKPG